MQALPKNLETILRNPTRIIDEICRRSFPDYFYKINPKLKRGWWQQHAAEHLQQFYVDLIDGKRPKLVIEAPPQHGKSEIIVAFISWIAGRHPEWRTIYTSFSKRLGVRANRTLLRIFQSEAYQRIFPQTQIALTADNTKSGKFILSSELIEFAGQPGSFRNTTVKGAITGEGLDLGVIDDPLKGREAANSPNERDKIWDWFTDDFFSRFSESAGLLAILTRWHIDDPIGRLINEMGDAVKVLKYPALAETGAPLMPDDPRKPGSGDALFPEHKSRAFLLERKTVMLASRFSSLYQQMPIQEGGKMFSIEHFKIVEAAPAKLGRHVRYWDKAGTQGGGAYTVGVHMAKTLDNQWIVLDVKRDQLSALNREKLIQQTAKVDGASVTIWLEQEPGSGGKESAEASVRGLSGYTVKVERVTGAKESRAEPYAAQVEAGNILLLKAPWNKAFIDEHETAPDGLYKDQWDSAAGAFNKLVSGYTLDNL